MDNQSPSAKDIIQRMAETYASCRTYQDSGTITVQHVSCMPGQEYLIEFKTAFARPDKFRFEYNENRRLRKYSTRMVIWTQAGKTYYWWTAEPEVKEESSLKMAIAGATGVSSCSAHTVPRMLMPDDITGWALFYLAEPKLLGTEHINETECLKIEGLGGCDNQTAHTVWLGKEDYLIRRLDWPNLGCIYTTIYHPEINTELDEGAFASGIES